MTEQFNTISAIFSNFLINKLNIDLTNIDIDDIITQRTPFRMFDRIVSLQKDRIVSSFKVDSENLFVTGGKLYEPALIENIAQTAAAKSGVESKQNGVAVPLGFIGAIKNLRIFSLPKVNSELLTTVTVGFQMENASIINGSIKIGDQTIAECEMKIFIFNERTDG